MVDTARFRGGAAVEHKNGSAEDQNFGFIVRHENEFTGSQLVFNGNKMQISTGADASFHRICVKLTHKPWLEPDSGVAFLVACLQIRLVLLTLGTRHGWQVAPLFREGRQGRLLATRLG